jgi:hypothetical protein
LSRIRSRLSLALATSGAAGAFALTAATPAFALTPTPPIPTPTPTPQPIVCTDPPPGGSAEPGPVITRAASTTEDAESSLTISWRAPYGCHRESLRYEVSAIGDLTYTGYWDASRGTTLTFSSMRPGTTYRLNVDGFDQNGNRSPGPEITVTTPTSGTNCDPFTPQNLQSTDRSGYSVRIAWEASPGCPDEADQYEISVDGVVIGQQPASAGRTASISGLAEDTAYAIGVTAIASNGRRSAPVTTSVRTVPVAFTPRTELDASATGSAYLRTPTPATLTLNGNVRAAVALLAGELSGTAQFAPGRLTMRAGGLLPLAGTVTYAPSGPTTGSLRESTLRLSTKQTLTFSRAKVLGFDLLAGRTCRTVEPATIQVASAAGAVTPTTTTSIATTGTLTLPKTTGCGVLGPWLAPSTRVNSVSLRLALRRPIVGLPPSPPPVNPRLDALPPAPAPLPAS